MRSPQRRNDRIRRKNAAGVAGIIVVAIAVLVGFVIAGPWRPPHSGCLDTGPRSLTVIAIDATDALHEVQRLAVRNELTAVIDQIPKNGGVQVWRIAPSE